VDKKKMIVSRQLEQSCSRDLLGKKASIFDVDERVPRAVDYQGWRRHSELLPFFWSANGITSMLASVLGMALSIEFGIAKTYALGTCLYVVCAVMIVRSRNAARSVEGPKLSLQGEIAPAASPAAPSTQSAQIAAINRKCRRRVRRRVNAYTR
jgi:hypothetical protein